MYQMFLRPYTPEGTLRAAETRLPALRTLGIDIVYLCPIVYADREQDPAHFSRRMVDARLEHPINPYRIADYFAIDPEYGTDEDFAHFVETAHSLNIRVMMDLVYMHCGMNAVFLARHPEYVKHRDGEVQLTEFGFPIINFESVGLREYLWNNMTYFVWRFDVDGYRCDCGDLVPLDFWEEGCRRIRAMKPDFIMLNEGWKPTYLTHAFDRNYGLSWMGAINAYVKGEGSAADVRAAWKQSQEEIPSRNGNTILALENHDYVNDAYEKRLDTFVPDGVMEGAFLLCATLPGTPFLYGGQEIADTRRHSILGCRENAPDLHVDWSRAGDERAVRRRRFLTRLYRYRHTLTPLWEGGLTWWGTEHEMVAFRRANGAETVWVAVNGGKETVSACLPADAVGGEVLLSRGAKVSGFSLTLAPGSYILMKA